jgi:RimJ/RimL family protein N-acetyltransferase
MPRLRLQTPRALDLLGMSAAASDPQAQRWLGWPGKSVTTARRCQDQGFLDMPPGRGAKRHPKGEDWLLAAVDPVGERLAAVSFDRKTGEVGGWLAPQFRGRSLGADLFAGVAQFAHEHLGVPSVVAGTEASNAACIGALSAAGFIPVAGPETHALPDGRVVPARWFHHESSSSLCCWRV